MSGIATETEAAGYDVKIHKVGGKHPDGTPIAIGRWTFETPVVRRVVEDSIGGDVLNACAGKTKLSQANGQNVVRNDINQERDADHHYDVCEINEDLPADSFDCVVFDPPFDQSQADEHYGGMHAADIGQARKALAELVRPSGTIVELGWNSHSVAAWPNWTRKELHIFERGPCLKPVFLTVDWNHQNTLSDSVGQAAENVDGDRGE
jgi:hypothetical protein